MFLSHTPKNSNGFTLIEAVVGVALLLIVFMGIFGVYRLGMQVIFQSKARIISVNLANQKIEKSEISLMEILELFIAMQNIQIANMKMDGASRILRQDLSKKNKQQP